MFGYTRTRSNAWSKGERRNLKLSQPSSRESAFELGLAERVFDETLLLAESGLAAATPRNRWRRTLSRKEKDGVIAVLEKYF